MVCGHGWLDGEQQRFLRLNETKGTCLRKGLLNATDFLAFARVEEKLRTSNGFQRDGVERCRLHQEEALGVRYSQ